jgi:tetratricopeptide (TPR) repeat protein
MRNFAAVIAVTLGLLVGPLASAQSGILLESSAVTEREDHLDLTIQFSCSLRYQSYSPAGDTSSLRVVLQIGPDCSLPASAQFPVERQLPADTFGLVRSIELQPGLAGGAELLINFNRIEKMVLAPTAGMRGVRVRITRQRSKSVSVSVPATPGSYAVNLESSLEDYPPAALGELSRKLKVPVYVSNTRVNDLLWHRLRAGPFDSRRTAERVLREVQKSYAAAWLAVDDEQPESAAAVYEAPDANLGTRRIAGPPETRADKRLDDLLAAARRHSSRKQYDDAISKLIEITASQDYQHRVDAQEMLGIVRERKGQLAQAKSVYEDFLQRYPEARNAGRVQQRLQALRTAGSAGRSGSGGAASGTQGWSNFATASQIYRRDNSQLDLNSISRSLTTQNALLNDFDWVSRHRGDRRDFTSRLSLGYAKDLMTNGPGDQWRISSAYVELNDRELGLRGRVGRQSRGMAGVQGTFDGALASWQWRPELALNLVAGLPAESTRKGPDSSRQFLGVAADFSALAPNLDLSVYAIAQQYSGNVDRRSIGAEARILRPGRTLVALLDYDIHFADINNIMVLGTALLESRWTLNFDASRQRSPILSLRNALIGQPTLSFDDLSQIFSADQLDQFALDRSAQLSQLSLSASHPLGERGQWTINLLSSALSGTPASGGIEAVPAPGRDDSITSELLINSLFRSGDTQSMALRYQRSGGGDLLSLGLGSRIPLGARLRTTARLRVDRRSYELDGSTQLTLSPSLRLDYGGQRGTLEFEAGAELGKRSMAAVDERNRRFFLSLGYRLMFDQSRRR